MSSSVPPPRDPAGDSDHPLARAFRSFTEAAGSLERTYGQLQGQVRQLREELEVTNRSLTASLEENRRMRERLRRIVEGLPCGVMVTEELAGAEEERIATLNPEAERLLGRKYGRVGELPAALQAVLAAARRSGTERELELPAARAEGSGKAKGGTNGGEKTDGAEAWVAIRHAGLEAGAEGASAVYIVRDITASRALERERERLGRQQALAEMSALLAHEIRNPLGSLELFAGLLVESGLEGERRCWIEHVQAGLRALAATVNNVLDLHNAPEPERTGFAAGELLGWAQEFLRPLARQAGVEIEISDGLRGARIEADRHLLEQVLLNLALNAFDFMPGGGRLSLTGLDHGAAGVEIEVRDTGPGISEEDLPRIFDAGFTTRAGSTGLGLAVCRRILEQHGGTIEAERGAGACFRLRLPAWGGENAPGEGAGA